MPTVVFDYFLKEYRRHRMARFALWVAAYGGALWIVGQVTRGVPGLLWFLLWVCLIAIGVYYLYRVWAFVHQHLLWSLRRRLIVAYIFIAVVPILLILLLVGLRDFIVNGQLASFLVASKLRENAERLRQLNRGVIHITHGHRDPSAEALVARLHRDYVNELGTHAASYPGLEITIHLGSVTDAFRLDGRPLEMPIAVPAWLQNDEFAGIVSDQGNIAVRAINRAHTALGRLTLILSEPFTPELLDTVGENLGPVHIIIPRPRTPESDSQRPQGGRYRTGQSEYSEAGAIRSRRVQVPAPAHFFDFEVVGGSTLNPVRWEGEKEERMKDPVFVSVTSRVFALNGQLLATLGEFSRIYVILFLVVAAVFCLIELVALVIGIGLTRSITKTVDELHEATQRVKAGDFSHRIGLPARDQLSALGEAFDSMTASVERLLRESQEKSRLESEIEIARRVQSQLFPQTVPQVTGLELYGICKPALAVSGDYYDFLRLDTDRVGLVLGDVSGKGISAALLMAAIQSALRAQCYGDSGSNGHSRAVLFSTAEIVARLNRQLYESTPPEKYVTFFYAVYDGETRELTYTNAGHLPPVLFRRGVPKRLTAGGTVVGLFESPRYEQAEIRLEPGDLLLAFTDGITEPESAYEEEFGEKRLLEVVRRALGCSPEAVAQEILRSVSDWTGSPELQDDMTVLVAQAVA